MFALRNLLKCNTARVIQQEFHRVAKDSGVGRRRTALDLSANELENIDIDDLESDFMDVHKTHREHSKEMAARKEQEKYRIVGQKYFKQKLLPNFLTWHDKEQIRYLYRTNPDEWTIQQLSESFPAPIDVITKIVKANWTKTKLDKITNHDRAVQKNWEMFKQGQLSDLPKDLIEHLQKFTDRSLNFQPFQMPNDTTKHKIELRNTNVKLEFSEIITSYERLKNTHAQRENRGKLEEKIKPPPQSDTYLTTKIRKSQPITLNELQNNLKENVISGKNIDSDDKLILEGMKTKENSKTIANQCQTVDLTIPKKDNTHVSNYVKTKRHVEHLQYPDQIKIPRNLVKKDNVYKLNDCYYDYDGRFLYRVPGMG